MSSILRALKKLEEEKSRKEGGQVDLTRDILRQSVPERNNPLKLPLLACALILIGGLGAWLLNSLMEPPGVVAPQSVTVTQPQPPSIPEQQPEQRISPPVVTPKTLPTTGPAVVSSPIPLPAVSSKPVAAPVPRQPENTVTTPAPEARPQLIVSGIVYQDDPEGRLAVVNDLPVMTGTVIEGAVVEEIRADGVLFSYGGKTFEVRFNP